MRWDADDRLDLIALLATGEDWKAIVRIGQTILDYAYPEDIFNGSSGDPGPAYIVALRNALQNIQDTSK